MPRGQLFINNVDVFTNYGVSLDSQALSALLAPPAVKDYPFNKSRLTNGSRPVLSISPRLDERTITLTAHIIAPDEATFFRRYNDFLTLLTSSPLLEIRTAFQLDTIYRCSYLSCAQFTQFMRSIAKFSIKLREWNPANRSINDLDNPAVNPDDNL